MLTALFSEMLIFERLASRQVKLGRTKNTQHLHFRHPQISNDLWRVTNRVTNMHVFAGS